jgi:hypothetical protein
MDEWLSFLGRPLPPAFELRVFAVAPGRDRPYVAAEWRGALVVVERGRIELRCRDGRRRRLERGEVLWLSGLPLRALHNPGPETAVLTAVTRRRGPPGGRRYSGRARRGRTKPFVAVPAWHACLHEWPDSQVLLPTARARCCA